MRKQTTKDLFSKNCVRNKYEVRNFSQLFKDLLNPSRNKVEQEIGN